jgi:hypothetical protein
MQAKNEKKLQTKYNPIKSTTCLQCVDGRVAPGVIKNVELSSHY